MSTRINEIHQSVVDAENLESVSDSDVSIADVFLSLVRHPSQIIKRWNWKSAILGALMRSFFYFSVFLANREAWLVTLAAVMVEFSFRFFTSGISGAMVQSFRKAKPAWLAVLIVSITLPTFGHTVEFFSHYAQEQYFATVLPPSENKSRQVAFAVSVLVSVISAMFNIFMMRSGVLLVGAGDETKTLFGDFKRIPLLVYEFVLFLPKQIIQFAMEFRFHYAIGIFLAFGFMVGAILGIARGKWSWAYATTLGAWAVLFGFIALVFSVQMIHKFITKK